MCVYMYMYVYVFGVGVQDDGWSLGVGRVLSKATRC